MKNYVFISNSSKPTEEKLNSRGKIICGNAGMPHLRVVLNRQ